MSWSESLTAYDRDLMGRGLAERSRRAYGVDLGQFKDWAEAQGGLEPGAVRHRDVRRYAATLSAAGAAPATVARKLAAIRGLYDFLVRSEKVGQNLGHLLGGWARSLYLGIAGLVALMFLLNRRFADLAIFMIAATVVGGFVMAPNDIASTIRDIWHTITG